MRGGIVEEQKENPDPVNRNCVPAGYDFPRVKFFNKSATCDLLADDQWAK